MLQSIYREHRQIGQLLVVLTKIHHAVAEGRSVCFNLVHDVIDYLQDQAGRYHHPKEDLIYDHFQRHYPEHAAAVFSLRREHQELEAITQEFMVAVQMVLHDTVIPLSLFSDRLAAYIERQRCHLRLEEEEILPKIAQCFDQDDWQTVQAKWQHQHNDPLFGQQIDSRYRALAAYLNSDIDPSPTRRPEYSPLC